MVPSIEQEIRDLHALFGSPRDPEGRAFVPLADAYRRAGDPSRALEILADGLGRHPDLAAGHLVAGLTRRDLADDAGAEDAFRRALDLDGDNARALLGLGRIIAGRGETAEGEALVARGVALDPGLGRQAAPDRVPRHSGNPEVVRAHDPGATESDDGGLAPLEWEVLDTAGDAALVDLAALAPEAPAGVSTDGVDRDPGPVDPLDAPLPEADAATPPEAAAAAPPATGEPTTEAPGGDAPADDEVVDVADLSPESVGTSSEGDVDVGDLPADDARDFLVSADAEAALFDAVAGDDAAGDGVWSGGDLDIDWDLGGDPEVETESAEVETVEEADVEVTVEQDAVETIAAFEVAADVSAGESPAAEAPVTVEDDLVLDPADLAPDDWTPDESMFGALAYEDAPETLHQETEAAEPAPAIAPPGDDLLVELADLAPDIEPGSRRPEPDVDEVLPTRTLGELYARQGLVGEAVKVFEDLVARNPGDADLRARLDELRTRPAHRAPAAHEDLDVGPVADPEPEAADDDPPVSSFLADLLAWTPDRTDDAPGSP